MKHPTYSKQKRTKKKGGRLRKIWRWDEDLTNSRILPLYRAHQFQWISDWTYFMEWTGMAWEGHISIWSFPLSNAQTGVGPVLLLLVRHIDDGSPQQAYSCGFIRRSYGWLIDNVAWCHCSRTFYDIISICVVLVAYLSSHGHMTKWNWSGLGTWPVTCLIENTMTPVSEVG